MKHPTGSAEWIQSVITEFIETSPDNSLRNETNDKAFETTLVGFSSGADPIYEEFKTHVGPFHWTPAEAFALAYPDIQARPEDLSVISWVLPQTGATRKDNRKEMFYPAERWARNRIFGEEFNVRIRKRLVEVLVAAGFEAVSPMLCSQWERKDSDRFVIASTWSERHAAYASGLGTFGLCDGLITPLGKAMRLGSVVARVKIPPTPRPYKDHHEYCLFFTKGTCGKCIDRCPVQAISKNGHDKIKCRNHLKPTSADYVKSRFHFDGYGCGLCQTGVPCESKIPVAADVKE